MIRRRGPRPLTDDELRVVEQAFPARGRLSVEHRDRYDAAVVDLLDRCGWEASAGSALTDPMRITIAARASILAIGFDETPLHAVRTVVVHPSTIVLASVRRGAIPGTVTDGPMPVVGHTAARGPVHLAWNQVAADRRHPGRRRDVVLHEFAHQLDFLDGVGDGTPPLEGDRRRRWITICQMELDDLRKGKPPGLLRPYAATNPSEFFAVATEVFMTDAGALREDRPLLHAVLADYYNVDPASWVDDADAAAPAVVD
ncbi:zinc-dependent peptidase [Euzebya rosea]|uniref:M90 family metallopeptidase n=1 Tax=Euzebya rosea TaxID=2052804 RepID=UPI000D3ED4A2|nr:M90 family metallopeptidase [Euzebya rosea]